MSDLEVRIMPEMPHEILDSVDLQRFDGRKKLVSGSPYRTYTAGPAKAEILEPPVQFVRCTK